MVFTFLSFIRQVIRVILSVFYFPDDNVLFCGDFLFLESVGRWDLPTGDMNEMARSITKIKSLSDDCKVYSGHGEDTTIGHEKKYNYYFQNV